MLFVRCVEDGGSVLVADVGSLSVLCSRIMIHPEDGEEFFVWDFFRVEGNVDCFRMAGDAAADLGIAWVRKLFFPARITDGGCHDAGYLVEDGLDAPEASCCEDGSFCFLHRVVKKDNYK